MLTEKDYCDYNTCVALREYGYVGSSRYYYTQQDRKFHYAAYNIFYTVRTADAMGYVLAIHLYDAQKFLREEKKMHIEIWTVGKKPIRYCYTVHTLNHTGETKGWSSGKKCDTYEEALSEGILDAIEILKEMKV